MNRKIRINFPVNDIDWRDLRVLTVLTRSLPGRRPRELCQSKPL